MLDTIKKYGKWPWRAWEFTMTFLILPVGTFGWIVDPPLLGIWGRLFGVYMAGLTYYMMRHLWKEWSGEYRTWRAS